MKFKGCQYKISYGVIKSNEMIWLDFIQTLFASLKITH